MARRNSDVQIPGIDDRPMTKERQDTMWERLATQEEVFFGVEGTRKDEGIKKLLPIGKPSRKMVVVRRVKFQDGLSDTHALG